MQLRNRTQPDFKISSLRGSDCGAISAVVCQLLTLEETMVSRGKFLVTALLLLAFTATARAQTPQVEKNVSMKMALMIIDGTLEQCTKDGYKVSVVIVDKAGNVAASVRGDGTN